MLNFFVVVEEVRQLSGERKLLIFEFQQTRSSKDSHATRDFIINVYCWIDEALRGVLKGAVLRRRGFSLQLSDSEVITMELVGEYLGYDTDKGIWSYFKSHWQDWFPGLGSRSNYAKHAANLWQVKQQIQSWIAWRMGAMHDTLHMADESLGNPPIQFEQLSLS